MMPMLASAQALPFVAADYDPSTVAKGGASAVRRLRPHILPSIILLRFLLLSRRWMWLRALRCGLLTGFPQT